MWITSLSNKILKPNAIALGNFDGLHKGHLEVIQPVLTASEAIGCSVRSSQNQSIQQTWRKTLVSFTPHPREFFTGQKRKLLTPLAEKANYLKILGIEQLILLPFDRELASLSPEEFVKSILVEKIGVRLISIGEDFRFGYQRQGDAETLKAIAKICGVEVNITRLKSYSSMRISSSQIRQALETGCVETANAMLGREYSLTGKIISGQQLGQKIGFPTANLAISPAKFLPRLGVYLVEVLGIESETELNYGLMNIGYRPTVAGKELTTEVHILNWTGNLYNQTISVKLKHFLRPEAKFESLNALKSQISQDQKTAQELIDKIKPHA